MRALITGIAGFVGAHLAEAIRAETDWEVWGAVIGSVERASAISGARILTTDLREPEQARVFVKAAQPDWVFHLAAQAYVPQSGPAPATLYTPGKAAPINNDAGTKTWWYNTDYSLGYISAWGIHPRDIALWGHPAMMRGPMTIEGQAIIPTEGACNTSIAWDVNLTFADGVRMRFRGTPNDRTTEPNPLNDFGDLQTRFGIKDHHGHGTVFVGSEGWLEVHRGGLVTGSEQHAEEPLPAKGWRSPQSRHHQRKRDEP